MLIHPQAGACTPLRSDFLYVSANQDGSTRAFIFCEPVDFAERLRRPPAHRAGGLPFMYLRSFQVQVHVQVLLSAQGLCGNSGREKNSSHT